MKWQVAIAVGFLLSLYAEITVHAQTSASDVLDTVEEMLRGCRIVANVPIVENRIKIQVNGLHAKPDGCNSFTAVSRVVVSLDRAETPKALSSALEKRLKKSSNPKMSQTRKKSLARCNFSAAC